MKLQVGAAYGSIGVELVGESLHVVAVVHRVEANRLRAIEEQLKNPRAEAREGLERQAANLRATHEGALTFAQQLVERWNLGETSVPRDEGHDEEPSAILGEWA